MSKGKRTSVWVAAAASALAVILGSAPVAALADSSTLLTGHPDLVAAAAVNPKTVIACFDQILATPIALSDASFFLQGYTESRKTGAPGLTLSSAAPASGGKCLVAAFTGPGDARSFSTLAVLAGAVSASVPGGTGAANVQGSVPLVGGVLPNAPGVNVRPQLAGATAGAATVAYAFNEPLTAAAGTNSFGFYTSSSGVFHGGTVTGFTPGSTVTVGFDTADAALLPSATRFVVEEGAVTDANGYTNPTGASGGPTTRLDLAASTGQDAGGGLTYHFDFSQAIPVTAAVCPAGFALFDASGVRYGPAMGSTPTISVDRRSVTVAFAPDTAGGDPAQITLATVAAGALDGSSCASATAPLNSEGVANLPGAPFRAGLTSGPDLQSFSINKSTAIVSFVFDAPVASSVAVGRFHLVDNSGGLTAPPSQAFPCLALGATPAPQFTVGPANQVNVNYSIPTCLLSLLAGPPDVSSVIRTVGVTVDEGGVSDAATTAVNPIGSLGVTPTGPTGPTGPTVPPVVTVPPPPPTTPATTTKPVVKPCHRVVTIHLLTTVSRNLRSATATVNGKKATVSKKLTLVVDFAKYAGTKSIVVKIKGKLKNHHSISTTRTYKNKC
jgi:hypothetical protein